MNIYAEKMCDLLKSPMADMSHQQRVILFCQPSQQILSIRGDNGENYKSNFL